MESGSGKLCVCPAFSSDFTFLDQDREQSLRNFWIVPDSCENTHTILHRPRTARTRRPSQLYQDPISGLDKNAHHLFVTFALANLFMARRTLDLAVLSKLAYTICVICCIISIQQMQGGV